MRALVLGVGNWLMGDEGVGVHAIQRLQKDDGSNQVEILDGGTGGFHLLSLFQEYDPIILIDAIMDEHPPGTLRVLRPRFATDFPRGLSAHDIGLRDLLETATLLGPLPELYLIAVSIGAIQPMETSLSPPIESRLEAICETVRSLLKEKVSSL